MKKKRLSIILFVLCLSLVMAAGCARKATVKSADSQQQIAATDKQASDQAARDKAAEDEAARQKALRDQAMRDAKAKADAAKAGALALADIFFDYDKYQVRPPDRDVLKKNAEWMMKNRAARVIVEGHCDERGTTEYNLALGENRAKEASKYLISLGVEKDRLKIVSYGEERPFDVGHTEEAWAKNRRAHFVVNTK